jgi:hypothetical protein
MQKQLIALLIIVLKLTRIIYELDVELMVS